MKQFTARGPLKFHDDVEDRLIILQDGDTISVRDGLAEFFAAHGWGTAEGIETGEAKPGMKLMTEEHAELMRRPDSE